MIYLPFFQMDIFVNYDTQSVFASDGLTSSHPICVHATHPDEIQETLDSISYHKVILFCMLDSLHLSKPCCNLCVIPLFCEMLNLGVILKLGIFLNLMKIQRWSKLGNGFKVSNRNKRIVINNAGMSGCWSV